MYAQVYLMWTKLNKQKTISYPNFGSGQRAPLLREGEGIADPYWPAP